MASPAQVPFASLLQIDRTSSTPVYLQLANQLINAIQRRYIAGGTQLPGTRQLAQLLHIHRNTAVAVYQELEAQGWMETRPNKGSFIIGEPQARPQKWKSDLQLFQYPTQTGFNFQRSSLLDNIIETPSTRLHLNDGLPDIRLTQIEELSRQYSAALKRKINRKQLGYLNQEGSEFLRWQLANYLNLTRGLHIGANNLLLTRGTEMSVYIAARALLQPNDIVVVGSPGYFSINMILQQTGAKIKTVPVDHDGISVEAVQALCEKKSPRLLYITPHHHYPTTASLSAQRRIDLLKLAAQYRFIILEDDFDYDFHFTKAPVLPLASADTNGMVVYTGVFGKSLAPGFRTGFIVAPENLIQELRKHLQVLDKLGDPLLQQVLGELIEDGAIHRYIKKSVQVYAQRRDTAAALLQQQLSRSLKFDLPNGGLAFWLNWTHPINLLQLARKCNANALFIPRTILYQQANSTALRFGFGHLNEAEMKEATAILAAANHEQFL